jgi:hypothetical protein
MEGELVFKKKTQIEKSGLDSAIDDVLSEMKGFTADADEYSKMVDQLTKLYSLKACDKPERVSKDTLAVIFGNIVCVVVIVGYERSNIVTSRALNLLIKLR